MSNILNVEVTNLTEVLALYDQIKIYRSATVDGTFAEITDSSTRLVLNTLDSLYAYIDTAGVSTDYYKTSYFNSTSSAESSLSAAVAATTSTQLLDNMEVVITLSEDIADTDGNSLGEELEYSFFTTMTPFYSNIRRIRLEMGSFLQDVADYTVAIAILEASLMADSLTWVTPDGTNTTWLNQVRKEWTTCKTSEILLYNVTNISGGLKSKRLDNLQVVYDPGHANNLLDKVLGCLARWEAQLNSAGAATQTPVVVVKGDCAPDEPNVGRMWERGPYVAKRSGANQRYNYVGSRRYIKGWRNPRGG